MVTKLQKWGNSQGIRISKEILKHSQISVGESISISAKKGQITIKPMSVVRGKHKLKDLINQVLLYNLHALNAIGYKFQVL